MKLILTPAAAQRLRAHLESTGGAHLLPPQLRRVHKRLARGISKEDRDAARAAETAEIRAYVERRDVDCVICLEPTGPVWELHHVDSGSGKAQRQSRRNCCKTHEGCHKRAHRGELDALLALLRWARAYGYCETVAVIERRIAKKHEAHRTPTEAA